MVLTNQRYPAPHVVVALDFAEPEAVYALTEQLTPALCRLKVGKELFTRCGKEVVSTLVAKGFAVFLDLKFHDIPNTVAKACLAAAELGVWMINVHALGGSRMMAAAVDALQSVGTQRPLLTAVTVLTSHDQADLTALGITRTLPEQVLHLAKSAQDTGVDGVVCSAHEAHMIRQACGDAFCIVTPGIRPVTLDDDQKRVMTPAHALQSGSNYLVIGRPITQAENPCQTLIDINQTLA